MSNRDNSTCNRGFSLVEFMVAIVLGSIIIGGAVSVYLASKNSYNEVEQVAELSENGRFALQVLNDSLRHIGFFGAAHPSDVRQDAALDAVTGDCTGQAAAYVTNTPLFVVQASGSGEAFGCITDAVPTSDVLVIKSVLPSPLYDADPDDPNAPRDGVISFPPGQWSNRESYIIANNEAGILLDGADTPPDVRTGNEFALGVAWPYRLQVFYLRAGNVPTLSRKVLRWDIGVGAMAIDDEDLVSGVENLRLRFGFDSDNDGEVDSYDYSAAIAANEWDRVQAVEAFILMRSAVQDPGYVDSKTYRVGDVSVTPGDSFRRMLVHGSVSLRNPKLAVRGEL